MPPQELDRTALCALQELIDDARRDKEAYRSEFARLKETEPFREQLAGFVRAFPEGRTPPHPEVAEVQLALDKEMGRWRENNPAPPVVDTPGDLLRDVDEPLSARLQIEDRMAPLDDRDPRAERRYWSRIYRNAKGRLKRMFVDTGIARRVEVWFPDEVDDYRKGVRAIKEWLDRVNVQLAELRPGHNGEVDPTGPADRFAGTAPWVEAEGRLMPDGSYEAPSSNWRDWLPAADPAPRRDEQGRLTREGMEDVIDRGRSVTHKGKIYTRKEDLPAAEELWQPPTPPSPPAAQAPKTPIVLNGPNKEPTVFGKPKKKLPPAQYAVVKALVEAHRSGKRLSKDELYNRSKDELHNGSGVDDPIGALKRLRDKDKDWAWVIDMAGTPGCGYGLRDEPPTST